MELHVSKGYRCWSVLQVVVIVICNRGKVSSEIAQGCVESRLCLICEEMKVIEIADVVLGDSKCGPIRWCCITDGDCTRNASAIHTMDVHHRCNGKSSCTVDVIKEGIDCGLAGSWSNNDFERITYNCVNGPRRSTTSTPSRPHSTEDNLCTEKNQSKAEAEKDDTKSSTDEEDLEGSGQNGSGHEGKHKQTEATETTQVTPTWVVPVVMATICLLVLIAIVAVVLMMRRKRWPKGGTAVEMTDIDINEAIYANETQAMSLSQGNGSPIYSNDKIKKSKGKGVKASVPDVAVYSLANDADTRPRESSHIYSDVEDKESAYEVTTPRANIYSVVRDVGEPECAGSKGGASNEENNVYSDVETREPAKAINGTTQSVYDEAFDWKENEYKAVKAEKSIPAGQKKKTDGPALKTTPDSYTNVNKPSDNATDFNSNAEAKDKLSTSDGFPSPTYETMSPGIPESIYANQPALSPSWSMAARALSTAGSETESAYCDMQSPGVRFKDDGGQTLVENDLYSH